MKLEDMKFKALKIESSTFNVYRNFAAASMRIILPLNRIEGDYMLIRKTKKGYSEVGFFGPAMFHDVFEFCDLEDRTTLSSVHIKDLKFVKRMLKRRKAHEKLQQKACQERSRVLKNKK